MLKNPYINALLAASYIVFIVIAINRVASILKDTEDTILAPMTFLSLFVLSAAIMGLLFVYTPAKMFLEGQKSEAFSFLVKIVGTFACFVVLFVVLLLVI